MPKGYENKDKKRVTMPKGYENKDKNNEVSKPEGKRSMDYLSKDGPPKRNVTYTQKRDVNYTPISSSDSRTAKAIFGIIFIVIGIILIANVFISYSLAGGFFGMFMLVLGFVILAWSAPKVQKPS